MNEGLIYGSCDAFHQTIFNSRTQFGAEWKVYEFHGNVENFHPRFSFLFIFGEKPEIRAFLCRRRKNIHNNGSLGVCFLPSFLTSSPWYLFKAHFVCSSKISSALCILLFHVRFSTSLYQKLKIIIATKNSISRRKK